MPRAFGKSYNPVVFILVQQAGRLHCGIAEVHNTFGERHSYVLPAETRAKLITALRSLENKRDTNPKKKHGNIPL